MRNTEHPAYHPTERKLRRAMSNFSNFEALLRDDGFDYDSEHQWVHAAYRRLTDAREAAGQDAEKLKACAVEEWKVEEELFLRMQRLNDFIHAHAPDHPSHWTYRLYMALWHQCHGEPVRELTTEDRRWLTQEEVDAAVVIAPTVYGVPYEKLDEARLDLGKIKLDHNSVVRLILFGCGLMHAVSHFQRYEDVPTHDYEDGLGEAAREALEEAVDYANEPATIDRAQRDASEFLPKEFRLLFMAVARGSCAFTPAVFEWLHTAGEGRYTRNITSLIFAMGVRAFNDPYAARLIRGWAGNTGQAFQLLPEGCREILKRFNSAEDLD